ncbi:MAG: NAD(P)-dependent oxidoreductase [Candidatus Zixiibacteriota bacterium]
MKTGFIGLGSLGKAMANRLIAQGVDLIAWNRTQTKADDLNVEIAATPAELATRTEIIFLSLFGSDAVREVLQGENGLLAADCHDKIIVDTTTNHYLSVMAFHEELTQRGAWYLEAPVLGSVVPAARGELVVLVSGQKPPFETVRPLLEHLSRQIFYLEPPGLATKMKLVNNLVLGSFMVAIAEAIALAEHAGISRGSALDILVAGAGNSALLNAKKSKLLEENFAVQFSAALIHKDLSYLEDLALSVRYPMLMEPVVKKLYDQCVAAGIQDLDFSAVYKLLKSRRT